MLSWLRRAQVALPPGLVLVAMLVGTVPPAFGDNGAPTKGPGSGAKDARFGELAYRGLPAGEIRLAGGVWRGTGDAASGSPSQVELGSFAPVRGDFDRDRKVDALVVLIERSGAAVSATDLAWVAGQDEESRNVDTIRLVAPAELRDVAFADGKLIVDLMVPRAGDSPCCPTGKERRWYRAAGEKLELDQTFDMGSLSSGDLEGAVWELDPAPGDLSGSEPATARFLGERLVGFTGCNSYGAMVTAEKAGALSIGAPRVTRRPCRNADAAAESQFLERLRGVTGYAWSAGRLALSYSAKGSTGTLYFRAQR